MRQPCIDWMCMAMEIFPKKRENISHVGREKNCAWNLCHSNKYVAVHMKNVSHRSVGCFFPIWRCLFLAHTSPLWFMLCVQNATENVCVHGRHERHGSSMVDGGVRLRESEVLWELWGNTTTATVPKSHNRQASSAHPSQLSFVKFLLVLQPLRPFQLFLFRNTDCHTVG